jgi:hypothetical protein
MANQLYAWPVTPTGAATQRVSGTSDVAIAESNTRTSITFQNLGTNEVYIRLDSTAPTQANAHYVLAAPSSDQGGDGGFCSVDGVITAMKVGSGGVAYKLQIVEYVKG